MFGGGRCGINSGAHPATVEPWSALEQLHHEKEVIGFYLSGHPLDDHRLEIKHLCNTTLPELKDLDKLAGRELCFSGIVTGRAPHRQKRQTIRHSRRGRPFRNPRVHALQRRLPEIQALPHAGTLLLMKGRASVRTWGRDEGQLEFKLANIDLLGDAREKYITKLNLKIEAERVTEQLAHDLQELLKRSPGKCAVHVQVQSPKEKLAVDAPSKGMGVALNEELLRGLDGLSEVTWALN
jgi:DNA polymerase-3 subunit alpha